MPFDPDICRYFEPRFKSASQRIRVASERWTTVNLPCPACSSGLKAYPNNMKVRDLHCGNCDEQFQLKSAKHRFVKQAIDGQYETQIESVRRGDYPSLLLLWYQDCKVEEVTAIHKSCIIPDFFVPRKPLSATAQRAFWKGCNISLLQMPSIAKITLVLNQQLRSSESVHSNWQSAQSLLKTDISNRGWLADTLKCVEEQFAIFKLQDLYATCEARLQQKYPDNHHVKDKIRQQLQRLRDLGFVEFLGSGTYRYMGTSDIRTTRSQKTELEKK